MAWLTIITLLALVGGAIVIAVAIFVFPGDTDVVTAKRLLATWIGGSMMGFGLLSLLFTLTGGAITSAIANRDSPQSPAESLRPRA